VIDHLREWLANAVFGGEEWLRLDVIESAMEERAWTPRRGRLALRISGEPDRILHEFREPESPDRLLLPRNAPSAAVEGPIAFDLRAVVPGSILVLESVPTVERMDAARAKGAVALLSADLGELCIDPTGKERHLDAIAYRSVPSGCSLPVGMLSRRSLEMIRSTVQREPRARISFDADVVFADRPLRTLVATIVGGRNPGDAVVLPAHVQEPGACDNASGVATMLEGAVILADLVRSGDLQRPARSIAFLWGAEMEQSRVWIQKSGCVAVAAITAEMTGNSMERTGAEALLERMPDPGAVDILPPDSHTPWGAERVTPESLRPDGLSIIARCAMIDVAGVASKWPTREHPYEGGSDHAIFLDQGTPAVLFWHFTDFAYHTSLDRLGHVDPEEMRRTGSAILVTALAVADARATDLERYLESMQIERSVRFVACAKGERDETAALWKTWFTGVRLRLVELCLDLSKIGISDPTQISDPEPLEHP
jgi:hypothetical protein